MAVIERILSSYLVANDRGMTTSVFLHEMIERLLFLLGVAFFNWIISIITL